MGPNVPLANPRYHVVEEVYVRRFAKVAMRSLGLLSLFVHETKQSTLQYLPVPSSHPSTCASMSLRDERLARQQDRFRNKGGFVFVLPSRVAGN